MTLSVPSVDLVVEPRRLAQDSSHEVGRNTTKINSPSIASQRFCVQRITVGGEYPGDFLQTFCCGERREEPLTFIPLLSHVAVSSCVFQRGTLVPRRYQKIRRQELHGELKINPQSAGCLSLAWRQCPMNVKPPCISRLDTAELIQGVCSGRRVTFNRKRGEKKRGGSRISSCFVFFFHFFLIV